MEKSLPQRLYVLSLLTLSYIVGEIAHFLLGMYVKSLSRLCPYFYKQFLLLFSNAWYHVREVRYLTFLLLLALTQHPHFDINRDFS
jgi:hypothetical protein